MTDEEHSKLLEYIHELQKQNISLRAELIQNRAEVQAVFLCLRDYTKADPKKLIASFSFYSKQLHQKQLEKLEDISPSLGALLDERKPEDLP